MINVIPINKTNPDRNMRFLNCINQNKKNKPFRIRKRGNIKVKTDRKGNTFGAKKGNTYAMKVSTVKTILKKNITLLNHESRFIYVFYLPTLNKNSFSAFVKLSYPD